MLLIVTGELDENLFLAARNLYKVDVRDAAAIDPVSLIAFDKVVMTADASNPVVVPNNGSYHYSSYWWWSHKQAYRIVDFKRNKMVSSSCWERLEYDPNRSANIALVLYKDGERRYILAPKGLKAGDQIQSGVDADNQSR
ncbi:unnamed protein product [Ranitomeya imitator]|uniref:Large ribosomal subunit protein uL2 RNA-binding domain-containing protein n=1 Tax=Ranitomeya imitator TaxID=111125 RepID=A0ABN9M491_9NEOB|nr:unnamed protein product [Ranitomeya imitator]